MPKVILKDISDFQKYKNKWNLVVSFLAETPNKSLKQRRAERRRAV